MFIKVNSIVKGKPVPRHVNVLMCTVIHDVEEGADNPHNFKSVLYNSNGYAMYSYLNADDIIQAVQGNVVTEEAIQSQQEGS